MLSALSRPPARGPPSRTAGAEGPLAEEGRGEELSRSEQPRAGSVGGSVTAAQMGLSFLPCASWAWEPRWAIQAARLLPSLTIFCQLGKENDPAWVSWLWGVHSGEALGCKQVVALGAPTDGWRGGPVGGPLGAAWRSRPFSGEPCPGSEPPAQSRKPLSKSTSLIAERTQSR